MQVREDLLQQHLELMTSQPIFKYIGQRVVLNLILHESTSHCVVMLAKLLVLIHLTLSLKILKASKKNLNT